jgi:hypothetical protein
MEIDKTIYEYIWRRSYQVCAWEKGKIHNSFPIVFGSGFILKGNEDFVFVTADHVIHHIDYEIGKRTNQEYDYALPTNTHCKDKLGTILATIPGFYSFEEYDFRAYIRDEEDLQVAMIPDLKDIAFSRFNYLKCSIYTDCLNIDNKTCVPGGLEKTYIEENTFATPSTDKSYLVMGIIKNDLKDGLYWIRNGVIHKNLHYVGINNGLYTFRSFDPVSLDNWEGLSGSPFFSDKGELIGMLLRAEPNTNMVFILPIQYIIKYIKLFKQLETNS